MRNRAVFKRNLRVFEKHYSDISDKVKSAGDASGYIVEESRKGLPALSYRADENPVVIHSREDPEGEALRWAKNLGKQWDTLVLFGMGLGYHLLALEKLYQGKKIIIVERDYSYLRESMYCLDLEAVLKKKYDLIINPDPRKAGLNTGRLLTNKLSDNIIFRALPGYETFCADYWEKFRRVVADQIKRFKVEFFTRQAWQNKWFMNFRDNFSDYMKTPGVNTLFNRFKNVPVVIVAAGPSLENNIHLLPELKNRALIIGAGSAIFPLLKRNIIPDLYLSFDPGENNYKYIFSKLKNENFPLAYGSTVYSRIVSEYPGPKFCFTVDVFNDWFEKQAGIEKGMLRSGGTIAVVCIDMALRMGANPVILIGQDLALTNLKQYAGDVGYGRKFTGEEEDLFQVEGISGPVYTNDKYLAMKLQIDDIVRQAASLGRTVIDASEGGAVIEGTEILTLRTAIDRHCQTEYPVHELIYEPLQKNSSLSAEELTRLNNALSHLRREELLFHECFYDVIQSSKNILEKVKGNNLRKADYYEQYNKIQNNIRKVENTGLYQEFILKMIQHQIFALKSNINKRLADAKQPAEKAQQAAIGNAMLFEKLHESISFLEESIFKDIEKQLVN